MRLAVTRFRHGAALAALSALLLAGLSGVSRGDESRFSIVRIEPSSRQEAAFLLSAFDETHNHRDGYVELLLWPGDASRLEAAGFDYDVIVSDVWARDQRAREEAPARFVHFPGPDRTDYRHLLDYNTEMAQLAKDHPSLVRLLELPEPTLEGRTVYGVEIAAGVKNKVNDGRPVFYVDGIHHAREWPAGEYPMIFAHHLAERFGNDPRITSLLKALRVVIVPIVNPDGFDVSREGVVALNANVDSVTSLPLALAGQDAYWRKNRRSLTGVTIPAVNKNPDAYGVDPNRNYAFEWGMAGGSSDVEAMQDYRGTAPFSEPETKNIRALALSRHITGVVTNHTYGNTVLRAWGHTFDNPPDEKALKPIGDAMAKAMEGYVSQKGVQLYPTTGTTDDWIYAATGGFGFTYEHGAAFHPPYAGCSADCVEAEWAGVMEAFTIGAEAAAQPRHHGVLSGRVVDAAGRPVQATLTLTKKFKTPLGADNGTGEGFLQEKLQTRLVTDERGRFLWHVNPSTRPTVVAKNGRETYTLLVRAEGGATSLKIYVVRGRRLNLGTIRLTGEAVRSSTAYRQGARPAEPN
ncbi:MAG: M14 family metallopeptidase [Actinomycetota bacterium]